MDILNLFLYDSISNNYGIMKGNIVLFFDCNKNTKFSYIKGY